MGAETRKGERTMNHQRFGWHEDRPNMGRDELEQGRYPRDEYERYRGRGDGERGYGQRGTRGGTGFQMDENYWSSDYYGGPDRDAMGRSTGRSGYEDRYSRGSWAPQDMGRSTGRPMYGREGYFGGTRGWGYSDMEDYDRAPMRDELGRFTSGRSGGNAGRQRGMNGPHAGRGPKNYQRSEERIKEDVSDRLAEDGFLDASEIEVKVKDGIVMLTGTVESREEKRLAEEIAEDCSGVKDVQNQLRVMDSRQRGSGTKQDDTQHQGGSRKSA